MGLVSKDDGWRIPDELWKQMEALLPPRPSHPLGCHNPRVPDRFGHERHFAGLAHGHAVECLERDGRVLVEFGLSALSRVVRCGDVPGVLAARSSRVRRLGRHRLAVAGSGWQWMER